MSFSGSVNPVRSDSHKIDDSRDNKSASSRTSVQEPQSSEIKNNGFTIPSISLPKGGGAIRAIGEKFATNPATGTGSLTVPIFTSPGRSGFGPSLSLSYDSGSGNGPFGFGWSLSLPSITRKTSKGIPKYQDANESDIFILSGAEDLVPAFVRIDDGTVPTNVVDNDLNTRWSSLGVGQWIQADLGSTQTICSVDIAWYKGNGRVYNFVIATSTDGVTFTNVFNGSSSGNTIESEKYVFANTNAKYVRVTINGNNINKSASITELDIFGSSSPSAPFGCTTNIPISGVTASDYDEDWKKDEDGDYVIDEASRDGYTVRKYRPRTEGLFARIERWTHNVSGDVHWRSISKDNILTVYGKSTESRIVDPSDERKIYSWLICESYDDKGNAIVYKYAREDEKGIDDILSNPNERNRIRTANKYIKRIFYGNRKPLLLDSTKESFRKSHLEITEDDLSLHSAKWMFQVVFDYNDRHYNEINKPTDEQHQLIEASAEAGGIWSGRPDVFSTYRASFEVRMYRRCHRVLMFHHFTELGTEPYLVRSTEFDFSDLDYSSPRAITISEELGHKGSTRFASFIQNVVQSGYLKDDSRDIHEINGVKFLTYIKKSIPPLEFEYSKCVINHDIKEIDETSLENLPAGVDGSSYQFVDLDGEATSGILTEQADTWYYKPSLGDGKFGPVQVIKSKPSIGDLNGGRQQLVDLAGDGQLDVVEMGGPTAGYYERNNEGNWENFVPFQFVPNIEWSDPNVRLLDLTGDGHADILITENEVFSWYQSLAEKGFAPSVRVMQELNEEKGPRIVLNDSSQSVFLADMDGDGLPDLVRIKNGEVCYWPNLGYGKFGSKVTMDNSPWFDSPDQFDTKRLRLADADGSGVPDIFYIRASHDNEEGIQIHFNQSGNRWSDVYNLGLGLELDNHSTVQVTDLFGNGTACIVWSSSLPAHTRKTIKYLDLMGGKKSDGSVGTKPHLLIRSANNLGAETRVKYVSSTKFYLEDKAAGKPWVTRLPFPVHVIQQVETYDYISRNLFVTRYAYHHGYFDGIEQEFRGFGMVEQFDTEEFAILSNNDAMPNAENIDADSHVPPVCTKTWFHTGIYHGRNHVSDYFVGEYFMEQGWKNNPQEAKKHLLDDTILSSELRLEEEYEACRALRGSMLRQEIFSKDGSEKQDIPFTVTEQNFVVRRLQPHGRNNPGVFFTYSKEVLNYNYERNSDDPRTSHTMVLEIDNFGNVLKQVQIGYGRCETPQLESENPELDPEDVKRQTETKMIYVQNRVTVNHIDIVDAYRIPVPCESISFELTDSALSDADPASRFTDYYFVEDPRNSKVILNFKEFIKYEEKPTEGKQLRPIEHIRTLYRKNDLSSLLMFGEMDSLALPGDSYKLAYTPGLIDKIYKRPDPEHPDELENLLPNSADVLGGNGAGQGGYVSSQHLKLKGLFPQVDPDDHWWIPSGQIFYSQRDSRNSNEELAFAVENFFLPLRYTDPFQNTTIVTFDPGNHFLIIMVEDPIHNTILAKGIDYRVLQPFSVMDLNQNHSMVSYDALGMVVGTAVMGKQNILEGDNLDDFDNNLTYASIRKHIKNPLFDPHEILVNATARIVYDLFAYVRTKNDEFPEPTVVYTLIRETHVSDLDLGDKSEILHSFSYSDGFGREIQKKAQSESGPIDIEDSLSPILDSRWVGTGWTILNNKGKAVREYEPFFSDTNKFEFKREEGVGSIVFYDPLDRVVCVLHPNNTYEKIVYENWKQVTYDVNDTVLSDPRTDITIFGTVMKYFASQPSSWQTWYQQREGGKLGKEEETAANKTKSHADTFTVSYYDSLGRLIITLEHNGFEEDGKAIQFPTRIYQDIEGNTREVRDAVEQNGDTRGRLVSLYDYDMLGHPIHQSSMDANERWILTDVLGNPIRGWDGKHHNFRTEYDSLRRQLKSYLDIKQKAHPNQSTSILFERIVYGEQHPRDISLNLRGRIYLRLDQAGLSKNEFFDFKGNILSSNRQLAHNYKDQVDWKELDSDNIIPKGNIKLNISILDAALAPFIQDEKFMSNSKYDALNRAIWLESPHTNSMLPNLIRPFYNKSNLLEKLEVNLRGDRDSGHEKWTPFIVNIDYDAKGRRTLIEYGSGLVSNTQHGAIVACKYDRLTSRLIHILTKRNVQMFPDDCSPANSTSLGCLQNLYYTYDPIGNITHIRDDAQQSIFFQNEWVTPSSEFTYDALYRLIEATGREHLGQALGPGPHSHNSLTRRITWSPNDGKTMGRYMEHYLYDAVGNIESIRHYTTDPSNPAWSRLYNYREQSLVEPLKFNNRLSNSSLSDSNPIIESYSYDVHGNMIYLPHLAKHPVSKQENMHWNFKDQLQSIDMQGGGTAYYVYDSDGERIRKVWEKAPGLIEERIYLRDLEVFRKQNGLGEVTLERELLHVMDGEHRICLVETCIHGQNSDDPLQVFRYQLVNHLGSATLELDEHSKIISYEEYTPYGSTSYQAVRSQTENHKRYRFCSKEHDDETKLYYFGARFYAPWLAIWISCDPSKLIFGTDMDISYNNSVSEHSDEDSESHSGLNLYKYCNNNPIRYIDRKGNSPVSKPFEKIAEKGLKWLEKRGVTVMAHGAKRHAQGGVTTWFKALGKHLTQDEMKELMKKLAKSKLRKPTDAHKLVEATLKKFDPDEVIVQGNRYLFQRAFQRAIGREGEKILRVVVEKTGKIITYFPAHTFKRVAGAGAVALGIFEEGVAEAHAKGESDRVARAADAKRYKEEAESGIISWLFVDSYAGYEPPPPSEDYARKKSQEIIQKLEKAGVTMDENTRSEIFQTVYSAEQGRGLPADLEIEFPEEFINEVRLEQEQEEKRLEEYRKLHPPPERLWRGTFQ